MIERETWPPRCWFCGLFMSYDDLREAVEYSPYVTNPLQLEPNPWRSIHRECWEEADNERRERTRRIAWQINRAGREEART